MARELCTPPAVALTAKWMVVGWLVGGPEVERDGIYIYICVCVWYFFLGVSVETSQVISKREYVGESMKPTLLGKVPSREECNRFLRRIMAQKVHIRSFRLL